MYFKLAKKVQQNIRKQGDIFCLCMKLGKQKKPNFSLQKTALHKFVRTLPLPTPMKHVAVTKGEICKVRRACFEKEDQKGYSFAKVVRMNRKTARLDVIFDSHRTVVVALTEIWKVKASVRKSVQRCLDIRDLKSASVPETKQPVVHMVPANTTNRTFTYVHPPEHVSLAGCALFSAFLDPDDGLPSRKWNFAMLHDTNSDSRFWSGLLDSKNDFHSKLSMLCSPPYKGKVSHSVANQNYEALTIDRAWVSGYDWAVIEKKLYKETGVHDICLPETKRNVASMLFLLRNIGKGTLHFILGWSKADVSFVNGVNVVTRLAVKNSSTVLMLAEDSVLNFTGDAIVNAANEGCIHGGGVDGEVNRRGGIEVWEARMQLPLLEGGQARCFTGQAKMTIAGNLPCKHVIHAVGPRFASYASNDEALLLLKDAYRCAMGIAKRNDMKSVAFCLLSAGIYRGTCPLIDIVKVAIDSLVEYTFPGLERIFVCAYTEDERKAVTNVINEYCRAKA